MIPLSAEEIDDDGIEDLGEVPFPVEAAEPTRAAPEPPPSTSGAAQPPEPDEPPAHARKDWRKRTPAKVTAVRITAGVRADINAKISLPLEIFGQIWKARDPLCGGTFVDQRPEIADAFTNIVCDSADLVNFFTGPGGKFMKYLELGAAFWPVVEVGMAHHVYHSVEIVEDPTQPQMQGQYAA